MKKRIAGLVILTALFSVLLLTAVVLACFFLGLSQREILIAVALSAAAVFALACLCASPLVESILKPLKDPDVEKAVMKYGYKELDPLLEKIAVSERRRNELASNVSHELKTPLTSISGYAELIKNEMAAPEDIPNFAERIHEEARHLMAVTEDMMENSRIDEEDRIRDLHPLDVKAAASQVILRMAPSAKEKNISLTLTGDSVKVCASEHLLDVIWCNLIDNAVKYSRNGGHVAVGILRENDVVLLSVCDDGIGIPEEYRERVFERFFRVDKSHGRATGGTGLGLSIVKQSVSCLGGEISLTGQVGRGTKITVKLPAVKSSEF